VRNFFDMLLLLARNAAIAESGRAVILVGAIPR